MKALKFLFSLIAILFILWVCISYVDIVSDNILPNAKHLDWNIFVLLFKR